MADNWFSQNMGEDFWNFHNDVRRGYLGGINSMPFVMKPRDVMHPTELNPRATPQLRKGMYPQSEAAPLGLDTRGLDLLWQILGATRENPGALFQLLLAGNPNIGSPPKPLTPEEIAAGGGGPSPAGPGG